MMKTNSNLLKRYLNFDDSEEEDKEEEEKEVEKSNEKRRDDKLSLNQEFIFEQENKKKERVSVLFNFNVI